VISGVFNNKSVHFVGVITCVIVNMHGRTRIKIVSMFVPVRAKTLCLADQSLTHARISAEKSKTTIMICGER
jgi:hypothetical protein